MREIQDVTVETFDVRETGPYTGPGIAGASGDLVEAVVTKEYAFADGITIRVIDIPARLDRVTGTTYISGRDGKILMWGVRRYIALLRNERSQRITQMRRAPMRIMVLAPDLLAA